MYSKILFFMLLLFGRLAWPSPSLAQPLTDLKTNQLNINAIPSASPYSPGQYEAQMQMWPDKLVAQLPLDWMNSEIRTQLEKAGASGSDVTFQVITAGFGNFVPDSPNLLFHVDIDGKIGGNGAITMNFRCNIKIHFALPPARIKDAKTQNLGNDVDCGTSGSGAELLKFFQLTNLLAQLVAGTVEKSITAKIYTPGGDLHDWLARDGRWATLIESAYVQASYCSSTRWSRGFCINLGFPSLTLTNTYSWWIQASPKPVGPINVSRDELLRIAKEMEAVAPFKTTPIPYPAKFDGTNFDDDDTTIFSGLMCSSGITIGCDSVRNAQSTDGAFWRSPAQVNVGTNPMTGDQLTGVLNYFAAWGKVDPVAVKESLERYLKFVAAHRSPLPSSAQVPLDYSYKACGIPDPNDNCTVGAAAWMILNELANAYGLENLIPADVRDVYARFGYGPHVLPWEAMISQPGYRIHLIGVYIHIARSLGLSFPEFDTAAKLLASRQPDNPFFLYLSLGRDISVLTVLEKKCNVDPNQVAKQEWSWESADVLNTWKLKMYWDCAFMYRLLAGPPYFEPTRGGHAARTKGKR